MKGEAVRRCTQGKINKSDEGDISFVHATTDGDIFEKNPRVNDRTEAFVQLSH